MKKTPPEYMKAIAQVLREAVLKLHKPSHHYADHAYMDEGF